MPHKNKMSFFLEAGALRQLYEGKYVSKNTNRQYIDRLKEKITHRKLSNTMRE